jgi:hypothetical protein
VIRLGHPLPWLVIALVLASAGFAPRAGAATIENPSSPLRLGITTALKVTGVPAGVELDGYADIRGHECAKNPLTVSESSMPAVLDFSAPGGHSFTFTPYARTIRLCVYTIKRSTDGSTPKRTYLAERLVSLAFAPINGGAPVTLGGSEYVAFEWGTGALLLGVSYACNDKRFVLTRRIPIHPDWTFHATGAAVPNDPSEYSGHATLSMSGEFVYAPQYGATEHYVAHLTVHLDAPGLQHKTGPYAPPPCKAGKHVITVGFDLPGPSR